MIRRLRPTDTAALLPFRRAVGHAQAFTVAGALHAPYQGFPATRYIALALSLRAWRQCWVEADDDGIGAIARTGTRTSPQAWEIRDLYASHRDPDRCEELLREIASGAAAEQVGKVFLRTELDSWVTPPARRAGYAAGSAETLYVQADGAMTGEAFGDPPVNLRDREAADDPALFRMYCSAAPVGVRADSGMTATEWWSAQEKAWRRPREVVLDGGDRIDAWVRSGPVQGWWYFSVMSRPDAADRLPGLVLAATSGREGRPLATLVPAYDVALSATLERLGFVPERRFQLLSRTMVERVTETKGVVVAAH